MLDNNKLFWDEYILRDACENDIDNIFDLSHLLNTVNLPSNRDELVRIIEVSERSFAMQERDPTKRNFLFVLEHTSGRVVGTSQIFAKHGTLSSPHLYFQVDDDDRYSETLKKFVRHKTLRLGQSFDGPTEIGSLVLDKSHRSHPDKLGQNLSYVRFLFMAMLPDCFSDFVLAELLPPLGPNFESVLWDAVGRKFTGLDYYEADMLSRNNKEFIKTLFPSGVIYASLLPERAQEVIGQVGRHSRGAAELLSKIGFTYSHRVDPFDGGPHFEAATRDITLIKNAIHERAEFGSIDESLADFGLCGRFDQDAVSGQRFIACMSAFMRGSSTIFLPTGLKSILKTTDGALIGAITRGA